MSVPLEPIPAESPISGPFWTWFLPLLLFACSLAATWMLFRRFSRTESEADSSRP